MPLIRNGKAKQGETRLPLAILNSVAGPQGEGQDARSQAECLQTYMSIFCATAGTMRLDVDQRRYGALHLFLIPR
jgi:hypothetical protein